MVTRKGGRIILYADPADGPPEPFLASFERFHREHGRDLLGAVPDHFRQNRLIMEGGAMCPGPNVHVIPLRGVILPLVDKSDTAPVRE